MGTTAIYYRYSSSLGIELHPNDTARRCLEAGVAITAVDVWGNVLVDSQLVGTIQDLKSFEHRATAASSGSRWALARFILRYPVRSVRAMRRADDRPESSIDDRSPKEIVNDTVDAVRQQFAQVAVLEGLASGIDQDVVRPHYLNTEPWIRLTLPPVTIRRKGATSDETLDVSALMHRCGEAVVTFGELIEPPMGAGGLSFVNASASSSRHDITETTLDAELFRRYGSATQQPVPPRAPRTDDDGRPTITFTHESPACLDDIFHVYQEAICEALTGRGVDSALSEYLMLPFISVRSLDADRHSQVGQLLAKHIRADDISTADTRNPDFYTTPVIETYAGVVWASPACVVQIASTTFRQQALDAVNDGEVSGEAWLHAETATGLALDVALLRSGLTSRLAQRLANTSASEIEAISRSALAHHELLSGERLLNAGELAIIEEKLLDLHDFTRRGEALRRQRELAQGVAVADESRNSQRIARRIELIVAGLTIAVALPGVFGVLLQIGTWNHRFPIAGRTFEDWAPYIVAIPIVMVAAAGIAFLIWSTISLLRRRLRARNIRPLVALPQAPRRTAAPFPLGGLRFVPADEPDDEHE